MNTVEFTPEQYPPGWSPPSDLMTIAEFCEYARISQGSYFNMKRAKKGPAEMRVGNLIRISREAAERWRAKLEAEGDPHAPPKPPPQPKFDSGRPMGRPRGSKNRPKRKKEDES